MEDGATALDPPHPPPAARRRPGLELASKDPDPSTQEPRQQGHPYHDAPRSVQLASPRATVSSAGRHATLGLLKKLQQSAPKSLQRSSRCAPAATLLLLFSDDKADASYGLLLIEPSAAASRGSTASHMFVLETKGLGRFQGSPAVIKYRVPTKAALQIYDEMSLPNGVFRLLDTGIGGLLAKWMREHFFCRSLVQRNTFSYYGGRY